MSYSCLALYLIDIPSTLEHRLLGAITEYSNVRKNNIRINGVRVKPTESEYTEEISVK